MKFTYMKVSGMVKIKDPIGFDDFTDTEKLAFDFLRNHGPFQGASQSMFETPKTASETDPAPEWAAAGAFGILLHAPMQSLGLWQLGRAPWARLETGKRAWGAYEHEWVDEVLAIDSGNFSLTDLHLPLAISAGIRPEAVAAVLHDELDKLTEDERHFVTFIRQTASGKMDDSEYAWMKDRLGSDYAVIDYIMLILILVIHTRLQSIFEYPGPSREDYEAHIERLARGEGLIDHDEYEVHQVDRFKLMTDWLRNVGDDGYIKRA